MLTPEELRDLPEDVAEIFEECEDVILRLIAERINAVGYINTVSVWQLIKRKESLLLRKDVAKELARYTGRSEKEIRKIFKKAGAASLLHDDSFLKANTLNKKRKRLRPLDRILKKAYDQTKGTFRNWTGTTASNVSNRFVRAVDKAALQVQSGAFSYDEAIRLATRDLADHMDYVQYPSGHRDTLEVASRRAVRTGVNQMSSKLTLQRCKELGIEFVETTAHAGARVSKSLDCRNHSWWQGKVFHLSKEGAKGEDGKFYPGFYSFEHAGYGYGEGICGWNCRHSFHPYIPGISEQVYTPEELDKLNEKKFTYEGKQYSRYEADQYQRSLERTIRKYKRRAILSEGVGDQKETERNMSYIRKWSNELDKFIRATGLKRDYERERETVRIIRGVEYYSDEKSKDIQELLTDEDKREFSETLKLIDDANSKFDAEFVDSSQYLNAVLFGNEECYSGSIVGNQHSSTIILSRLWNNPSRAFIELTKDKEHIKTDDPMSIYAHEYGHYLIDAIALKRAGYRYNIDASTDILERYSKEKQAMYDYINNLFLNNEDKIKQQISIRASEGFKEFIAESVSQHFYGNESSKLGESLIEYLKERWLNV